MAIHLLTVKEITALQPGQALTDGGPRGSGALWFKASRAGTISAVFRYTAGGKVRDWSLGIFDPAGKFGITLAKARAKAGELSRLIQSGIDDPRAHLEEQKRLTAEGTAKAMAEAAAAAAAAQRAEEEQRRYTLRALMDAYVAHLERGGKVKSANSVRGMIKTHLLVPAPDLADTPARNVTKAALATLIRGVRESGKERSAGLLRSYLHSAYSLALRAEGDTEAPAAMISFKIEVNPVAGIKAIPVKAGNRALTLAEMRKLIGQLDDTLVDQFIKLVLFAGGQRGEQLLRAKVSDFDPQTGILRLWDGKGGRQQPREHRLPLAPVAVAIIKALVARARNRRPAELDPPLFASGGSTLCTRTIRVRMQVLTAAMGGAKFTFRDLRRSVETELAAMGIPTDIRAQLLSHGLSGVQAKHYDRHGYLEEKKSALVRWERRLSGQEETGKVVKLRRRG